MSVRRFATPREVFMRAQRIALVFVGILCSAHVALTGDAVGSPSKSVSANLSDATTASSNPAEIEPWIHGGMPDGMRTRLESGFELAVSRVREVPECRALFTDLGADALETLRTGLYFPIGSHRKEKAVCGRAVAYTNVGAAPTFLCRQFAKLSDKRAAMFVIHEALHHAGLPEQPHDRTAMTSREINTMVTNACQL
jgi:hypothetical protein